MLQESYHPGLAIPRWSVRVWNLYAQNDQFLYYSIVHPYYKGSTDKTAVVYTIGVYGYKMWYPVTMYVHVYKLYEHVHAM